MGADFVVAVLPDCQYSIDREIALKWAVEEMAAADEPWFGNYFDDYDQEEAKETLIAAIDEYFELDGRRDVGGLYLPPDETGIWYIVSGGLSWGDNPITDAYTIFEQMEELWSLLEQFAKEDRRRRNERPV